MEEVVYLSIASLFLFRECNYWVFVWLTTRRAAKPIRQPCCCSLHNRRKQGFFFFYFTSIATCDSDFSQNLSAHLARHTIKSRKRGRVQKPGLFSLTNHRDTIQYKKAKVISPLLSTIRIYHKFQSTENGSNLVNFSWWPSGCLLIPNTLGPQPN